MPNTSETERKAAPIAGEACLHSDIQDVLLEHRNSETGITAAAVIAAIHPHLVPGKEAPDEAGLLDALCAGYDLVIPLDPKEERANKWRMANALKKMLEMFGGADAVERIARVLEPSAFTDDDSTESEYHRLKAQKNRILREQALDKAKSVLVAIRPHRAPDTEVLDALEEITSIAEVEDWRAKQVVQRARAILKARGR